MYINIHSLIYRLYEHELYILSFPFTTALLPSHHLCVFFFPPQLFLHVFLFFFFNDTAPTEISPLPQHDALPICPPPRKAGTGPPAPAPPRRRRGSAPCRTARPSPRDRGSRHRPAA